MSGSVYEVSENTRQLEDNMIVYIASPFFKPDELERIQIIEKMIVSRGHEVISPRNFGILPPKASLEIRAKVFAKNTQSIDKSNLVLALLQSDDTGTIWEIGYAYGVGVPVIGMCSQDKINLMLAQSFAGFVRNNTELTDFLRLKDYGYAYAEEHDFNPIDFTWEVSQQWRKEIY